MIQAKTLKTFEVRVEQRSNSTWQGKLTTNGETVEFRSELELLFVMDRLLCNRGEEPCPQIPDETSGEEIEETS